MGWRDAAAEQVTIEVIAVGPRGAARALRETLELGVDRARLVVADAEITAPEAAGAALTEALAGEAFDLILYGEPGGGVEGLAARVAAVRLNATVAGVAEGLRIVTVPDTNAIDWDRDGRAVRVGLPAAFVFYIFEVVIVVTIQAFIFAALSAIYIGMAIEPEH